MEINKELLDVLKTIVENHEKGFHYIGEFTYDTATTAIKKAEKLTRLGDKKELNNCTAMCIGFDNNKKPIWLRQ